MDVDGASGAARRRRERRLRAWLRHERQSVAAAVAEALHHSAGPREKVVERRGRQEGEVHETHNALRSQTTPLPGKRPAPLSEVTGPQAAVTNGYVAAGVPLLGAPSLADSSAEAIDGSTLSFLLQHALEVEEKDEEDDVSVTRCRLRSTGFALVRQWIPVHGSVLFMRLVDFFFSTPLVSGSHLFGAPDEYMAWIFWETTSGLFPYSTLSGSTVGTCS